MRAHLRRARRRRRPDASPAHAERAALSREGTGLTVQAHERAGRTPGDREPPRTSARPARRGPEPHRLALLYAAAQRNWSAPPGTHQPRASGEGASRDRSVRSPPSPCAANAERARTRVQLVARLPEREPAVVPDDGAEKVVPGRRRARGARAGDPRRPARPLLRPRRRPAPRAPPAPRTETPRRAPTRRWRPGTRAPPRRSLPASRAPRPPAPTPGSGGTAPPARGTARRAALPEPSPRPRASRADARPRRRARRSRFLNSRLRSLRTRGCRRRRTRGWRPGRSPSRVPAERRARRRRWRRRAFRAAIWSAVIAGVTAAPRLAQVRGASAARMPRRSVSRASARYARRDASRLVAERRAGGEQAPQRDERAVVRRGDGFLGSLRLTSHGAAPPFVGGGEQGARARRSALQDAHARAAHLRGGGVVRRGAVP